MEMNVWTTELQHAISISALRASGPWEADVQTVEVESAISLTDERASGPMLTDVRTVIFELRFLPYLWARPDGKPHCSDGVSIFPYSELGKNLKLIDHWWTSGRDAERSGWMQDGTEASWYSGGSGRKDTSSGRMMLVCLASGRDDTSSGWIKQWTDWCPDGWQGIWNLLSFSQCRVFWKCFEKWNPCLQHLYT
jgi:hypothetical protein